MQCAHKVKFLCSTQISEQESYGRKTLGHFPSWLVAARLKSQSGCG